MTDKTRAELVLDFARVFLWPAIIVVAVMWLGPDLKEILKNRTWKIGVVEVGDRISNLKDSMQDSLLGQKDYLAKIKASAGNPEQVKELADAATMDLENIQKGIKKEISTIQESIPQSAGTEAGSSKPVAQPDKKSATAGAREWELRGFGYILGRDVNAAVQAFSEAEKNYSNYHNVAEIRRALVSDSQALASRDSPKWKELYKTMLKEFSWGMPADVRQQMQNYVGMK